MIKERAEEIIDSLGVINVTYKNNPIWIKYIERENETAHIKNLKTNESMEVAISDLNED
ncbi:H-type small acid-soluble spore protein [Clostridium ganghwense]|uniref:H-type small acid-soluble spore protein n=1 Tax=Clostridium ganghwense TaxID=312089 RepID=A0ABT4CU12_9CLOT|nr:H-type small acid-soluble spore protein [Clostridium ganghwense]MCY6372563.1 H-type small acid-soluble spore protein [Clostridium ganghwense]